MRTKDEVANKRVEVENMKNFPDLGKDIIRYATVLTSIQVLNWVLGDEFPSLDHDYLEELIEEEVNSRLVEYPKSEEES